MAAPTPEEIQLLTQFRSRIQDIAYKYTDYELSDICLLRWIRARDHNVAKAEDMIRKTFDYLQRKPEIEKEEPSEHYLNLVPSYVSGYTESNNPIVLVPFGTWNLKKIVKLGEQDAFEQYAGSCFVKLLKLMAEKSVLPDQVVSQFVVVMDFDGYSMTQLTSLGVIDLSLHMLKQFELNCPETLKTAFVVNASPLFSILFSIVKPFLTSRTLSKLHVFGKDEVAWKKAILEHVPADQLTQKYGGTLSDDHLRLVGGDGTRKSDAEKLMELAEITVAPGKKMNVECHVEIPNSKLSWKFRIGACDIGFRITSESENGVPLDYQRYTAATSEYKGSIQCSKPGKYALEFDNSYSLLRSKLVQYYVNVLSPEEELANN